MPFTYGFLGIRFFLESREYSQAICMAKPEPNKQLDDSFLRYADIIANSIRQRQVYTGVLPEVSKNPKKREVADLLGMSEIKFSKEHLATGNLRRLPGKYSFDRDEVIQLYLKRKRLGSQA